MSKALINETPMGERLAGLAEWLLSPAVLRETSPAGAGVANWLWPDGTHDGLYPEIGGYYLQFLALAGSERRHPGSVDPARARAAARRVIAWLDEAGAAGDPLTLYHRDMAQSDWRNRCLFVFDLAMILRGFACVAARWPGVLETETMSRYAASARSLSSDGRLASHRLRAGAAAADVPAKWSTLEDVHHVKAAAAIAGLGDASFTAAVSDTLAAQAAELDRQGAERLRELHPFLYLIEGWLMLWGRSGDSACLDRAGAAFRLVLAELDADRGTLPPIAGRADLPVRADVLAQALRAGLVLAAAGWFDAAGATAWSRARGGLRAALLDRLTPEGAVAFDPVGRHRNIWASLFCWQAFLFLAQAEDGTLEARDAAAALI